jgi:heat shock protein HslJ
MLTDDELDIRLRAAGERFRARTTEPARATPPRRTPRRLTPILATIASAAAVAALVFGIMQLTSRPGSPARPAVGSSISIAGVHWRLVAVTDASGTPVTVTRQVELFVDVTGGTGKISASDGCNAIGGPARLVGGRELVLGDLISTTMACPGTGEQQRVIDAVLRGTVSYRVDGGTLTLTREGAGSLGYTAVHETTPPDPKALVGPRWQLTGIGENSGDTVSMRAPSGRALLSFDGSGYRLDELCTSYLGRVKADPTVLVFGARRLEAHACPPNAKDLNARDQQAVFGVLSRAIWTLDAGGAQLTLSTSDTTLQFRR